MALRVTTTGTDVPLSDLGIIITHPTSNLDLTDQFTATELQRSKDLTDAIQNGDLVVDDGTFVIHSTDYDPAEVLNQELGLKLDANFVSHAELIAGFKNTYAYPAVFPLGLNSTANATRNVYAPAGRFGTWSLSPGDTVVISGSSAADGTYTIESVTDAQNLIVVETIPDSTGGTMEVFHPAASTRIGVDPTNLSWSTHDTLQEVLEDLDFMLDASGIEVHRQLDQLVHNIAEDSYEEITYSGIYPTNVTVWTDNGKTTKIREEQYSYTGALINSMTVIQYDENGTEVERMTETYTRTGFKITSVDRELI